MPRNLRIKPLIVALAITGLVTPAFAAYGKSSARKHKRKPSYGYRSKTARCAGGLSSLDMAAKGNSFRPVSNNSACWQNRLAIGGQVRFNFANFKDDLGTADTADEGTAMQFGRGTVLLTADAKISDSVSSHLTLGNAGYSYIAGAAQNKDNEDTAGTTSGQVASSGSPVSEAYVSYQDTGSSMYAKAGEFFIHSGNYSDPYAEVSSISQLATTLNTGAVEVGMLQDDSGFNAGLTVYSKNKYLEGKDGIGFGVNAAYAGKMDDVDVHAGFTLISDGRDVFRANSGKGSFSSNGLANQWLVASDATEMDAKPLYQLSGSASMEGFTLGADFTAAAAMIADDENSKVQVIGVHGGYKVDMSGDTLNVHVDYETAGKKSGSLMNVKNMMRLGVSQNVQGINLDGSFVSGKHISGADDAGKFSGILLTAKTEF